MKTKRRIDIEEDDVDASSDDDVKEATKKNSPVKMNKSAMATNAVKV